MYSGTEYSKHTNDQRLYYARYEDDRGASFTKLICIFDASFGNFLLCNAHNFVIQNNNFTCKCKAGNTMVEIK